jgi:hypothetical protein
MRQIRNRKQAPLSGEEAKEIFSKGLSIVECDNGICLIAQRDPNEAFKIMYSGKPDTIDYSSDFWWVDLTQYLKGEFFSKGTTLREREAFEAEVNYELLGIELPMILWF